MRTLLVSSLVAILSLCACAPSSVDGRLDGTTPAPGGQAIVGGVSTTASARPFQVSLQSWGQHFCGGTIVAAGWVVTANHCLEGQSASDIDAVAGVTRLSEGGQARGVAEIIRNPGFSSPEYGHDFALLRLSSSFSFNGEVQAIDWVHPADASAGLTAPGVTATTSGWGATSQDWEAEFPDQLREVDVPIVSLEDAESAYGGLSDDQLPAGEGGHDSCQGDSGGPLTVESERGTLLAGVVSWGQGCGDEGWPGLYARLSSFSTWMDAQMGGEPPDPTGDGWMCRAEWYGDGDCDCGCGTMDTDCPDNTISSCDYNECDTWQPEPGLQLDQNDPTQCVGGIPPDGEEGEGEEGEGEEGEGEDVDPDGDGDDDGTVGTQRRDDDEDTDDAQSSCASTGSTGNAASLGGLALLALVRRRRVASSRR